MQVAAPAAGSIQSHSGGRQPGQEGGGARTPSSGLVHSWRTPGGRTDRQGEGDAFSLATDAERPNASSPHRVLYSTTCLPDCHHHNHIEFQQQNRSNVFISVFLV